MSEPSVSEVKVHFLGFKQGDSRVEAFILPGGDQEFLLEQNAIAEELEGLGLVEVQGEGDDVPDFGRGQEVEVFVQFYVVRGADADAEGCGVHAYTQILIERRLILAPAYYNWP